MTYMEQYHTSLRLLENAVAEAEESTPLSHTLWDIRRLYLSAPGITAYRWAVIIPEVLKHVSAGNPCGCLDDARLLLDTWSDHLITSENIVVEDEIIFPDENAEPEQGFINFYLASYFNIRKRIDALEGAEDIKLYANLYPDGRVELVYTMWIGDKHPNGKIPMYDFEETIVCAAIQTALKDTVLCDFCRLSASWENGHAENGTFWGCEECDDTFCQSCFEKKHGSTAYFRMVTTDLPEDEETEKILCPTCYGRKDKSD